MATPSDTDESEAVLLPALHLLVLWAFAVAQPLFSLLSTEPSFFVIRGSQPADVLFLTFFLIVLAPLPLALLTTMAGIFGRNLGLAVQGFLVACLLAATILPAIHRLTSVTGLTAVITAAAVGIGGSFLYLTRSSVRRYVTYLSVVLLLFPASLLLKPGMRRVAFPQTVAFEALGDIREGSHIVFVILDELPVASLLDEQGRIDRSLFPHFAAFADDATCSACLQANCAGEYAACAAN